jgi:hypothetical protein
MAVNLRDTTYAVTCDRCHGHMFIEGSWKLLCPKCHGDGRILIQPEPRTTSQTAVLQMMWIVSGAGLVGITIILLLHWFKLL